MGVTAIVLAAGKGTRMKSDLPKVIHEAAGRPMVLWVLDALAGLKPDRVAAVVGHEAESVIGLLPDHVETVHQERQGGTGHAVRVAMEALTPPADETIVIVPGDAPLLRVDTLRGLLGTHQESGGVGTIMTAELDDPYGYGRILTDDQGALSAVVEERDASAEQRTISVVNAGMYAYRAGELTWALGELGSGNALGELYLTDVSGILVGAGHTIHTNPADYAEIAGVNSQEQLAYAAGVLRSRINRKWMEEGVAMSDPGRVYIDASVTLSSGVRLYPGVHLEGETSVGAGAEIGPDTHVRDSRIGEEAVVRYSVLDSAVVGPRASVGPYARLREGTVLGPEAKAGTFVEMKKTVVGARSKVPHLSYMGDATIGEDSNVGAGAITCNWDGLEKHPTVIGDRAFIGSDTMLVAPVTVGDDGTTGAGSVISKDVSEGALGVERSSQKEIPGYAAKRRWRQRNNP